MTVEENQVRKQIEEREREREREREMLGRVLDSVCLLCPCLSLCVCLLRPCLSLLLSLILAAALCRDCARMCE
jgi:hypothetical protein